MKASCTLVSDGWLVICNNPPMYESDCAQKAQLKHKIVMWAMPVYVTWSKIE